MASALTPKTCSVALISYLSNISTNDEDTNHHLSGHAAFSWDTSFRPRDAQSPLRHASITTTGNVYVQVMESNVMQSVNSHATTVLEGWTPAVESMDKTGRNVMRLSEPFSGPESNLVKFGAV